MFKYIETLAICQVVGSCVQTSILNSSYFMEPKKPTKKSKQKWKIKSGVNTKCLINQKKNEHVKCISNLGRTMKQKYITTMNNNNK